MIESQLQPSIGQPMRDKALIIESLLQYPLHYQHLAVERRTKMKTVSRLLHITLDVHLPLLPVIGRPLRAMLVVHLPQRTIGRNRYYHLQQHQS
jgi:hypothetical protein